MKQIIKITLVVIFAASQFSACKKKTVEIPVEEPVCKISLVRTTTQGLISFTYNKSGNPVSAVPASPTTGNPEAFFTYDAFNRISGYLGGSRYIVDADLKPFNGVFENYIRFRYEDENPASLPIGDTLRYAGSFVNGSLTLALLTRIRLYKYDEKGRIIQVFVQEGLYGKDTINYSYDERGNLIRPNISYDNQKNYRAGNKVLMLVDQNYSVNNPFVATSYDAKGLPLSVPARGATPPYHDNFLLRLVNFTGFEYDCDDDKSRLIQ